MSRSTVIGHSKTEALRAPIAWNFWGAGNMKLAKFGLSMITKQSNRGPCR